MILLYDCFFFFSFFFFFKQKTAYEMRISDWSSDVCSSDLLSYVIHTVAGREVLEHDFQFGEGIAQWNHHAIDKYRFAIEQINGGVSNLAMHQQRHAACLHRFQRRSEERRVGKECVNTCRSRRSPSP